MEANDLLCFNGINGANGAYHMPPMAAEQLLDLVKAAAPADESLVSVGRALLANDSHYGVEEGLDAANLAEAGWGVIFPHDMDEAVMEALQPLLQLRQEQAGERFRVYRGPDGYQPDETKSGFLARHGVGPGPAHPETVPYYLMIVAAPHVIPFSFQFQLDIQYAVGRLSFESLDEYAAYARTVVASEAGFLPVARNFHLLGVVNPDDRATLLSLEGLVQPLAENLGGKFPDWQVTSYVEDQADKSRMLSLLSGEERTGLLFSASHGMSFPHGDTRQLAHQGALLCGEWPGPKQWREAIPQDFYVAGDDLSKDAGPGGLVSFHHACYGAGVPLYDDFSRASFKAREALAPHPFISGLPQRMLSHPKGGALAVVGHVDRAWGYSFDWPGSGSQTAVFESALTRILNGQPVGMALDYFNERYAELAAELTTVLEALDFGKKPNYKELAATWTAHNDARDYVLLGDPAVRLPLDEAAMKPPTGGLKQTAGKGQSKRPTRQVQTSPSAPQSYGMDATSSPEPPFGLAERTPLAQQKLSVAELTQDLLAKLNSSLKGLDEIEVRTYSGGENISSAELAEIEKAASPGAYTRISVGGDLTQIVPNADDPVSDRLMHRHNEAVHLATNCRASMVRAIGDVLAQLLSKTHEDGGSDER